MMQDRWPPEPPPSDPPPRYGRVALLMLAVATGLAMVALLLAFVRPEALPS